MTGDESSLSEHPDSWVQWSTEKEKQPVMTVSQLGVFLLDYQVSLVFDDLQLFSSLDPGSFILKLFEAMI